MKNAIFSKLIKKTQMKRKKESFLLKRKLKKKRKKAGLSQKRICGLKKFKN